MKKYFYSDGSNNFGPFTFEELREKKINSETLVWFQDLEDWTSAGKVEELKELFIFSPPPIIKETKEYTEILIKNNAIGSTEKVTLRRYNEMINYYGADKFTILSYIDEFGNKISDNNYHLVEKKQPPKTYLTESIFVTLFCCLPLGIVGIVKASEVESLFYKGDIDGAKRSSEAAKKWTSVSFGVGLALGVVYFIIEIVMDASKY